MYPLLEEFIDFKRSLGLKEKTISEYIDAVSKFLDFYCEHANKSHLVKQSYKTITTLDMQTYSFKLRETKSVATTRKYQASVSEFFRFLKAQNYISVNPLIGVQMQKDVIRTEREYMKVDEAIKMVEAVDNNYEKLMISLMFYQGYRIEEVTNIEVKNIDLENNTITALRKHGKLQNLKVLKEVREMLVERVEYCNKNGHEFLFKSPKGNYGITSNSLRTVFNKWNTRLGFNEYYSPHDLRRACASLLHFEKGLPLLKVSKFMNHSNVNITMLYLKISMESLNNELDDL